MGVFSTCTLCGKKKISLFIGSDGLCSACHAIMETLRETQTLSEKEPEPKEKIDVSDLLKQADPGYSPPPAPSDEPVYVFVDVETTGLKATEDAIVQVSALRFFGKKTIDGLNSYVNPLRPIPEKVVAIHGITDDKVKDAPTIDEIKEPFMNLIKDAILVGHNAPFDLDFLNHAFHGVLDGVEYIDTMEIAKAILNLPNYRLETVADYVEFHPEGNYHDSLIDCTATAAVFFRLDLDKPFYTKTYHSKVPAHQDRAFTPKDLVPAMLPDDFQHPLRGKRIVFTGNLSICRLDAAQMATDVGAIVRTSVSGKTDYLVVGAQDSTAVDFDGTSGKEKKAHELNALGKASIKIIREDEFMSLLEGIALHE